MSDEKRTISTEYKATDAGYSAAVSKISSAFDYGAKKASHFKDKINEFRRETGLSALAALGLGVGIGAWAAKAKEANAEFARTQKGIAGILAGSLAFEKGASEIDRFNRSMTISKDVTDQLDETAARFVMNLDDVATTYKTVSAAAGGLGLTQRNVMELTEESIATAKRFGVTGEEAARSIARTMQTGVVKGYDEFSISLRRTLGDMKKLTQAQRLDHIQKALKGSMEIADAMSGGIGGALARAQNVVEDLLRDVTSPLFKEIANSLQAWSKHMRDAKTSGQSMIDTFGGKLVKAFQILKDVSGFIKDHWMGIAAVVGAIKAKDLAMNLAGNLQGFGKSAGGALGGAAAGIGGALGQMAGNILPVIGALAAFKVALDGVVELVNKKIEKSMDDERTAHGIAGSFGIAKKLSELGVLSEGQERIARRQVDEMRKAGVVNGSGKLDKQGLSELITNMSYERRKSLIEDMGVKHPWLPQLQLANQPQFVAEQLANKLGDFLQRFASPVKAAVDDKSLKFAKQINNFNGGIHVQMKVEDPDPDRVFVRFIDRLHSEVSSQTQARTAEPQGD